MGLKMRPEFRDDSRLISAGEDIVITCALAKHRPDSADDVDFRHDAILFERPAASHRIESASSTTRPRVAGIRWPVSKGEPGPDRGRNVTGKGGPALVVT